MTALKRGRLPQPAPANGAVSPCLELSALSSGVAPCADKLALPVLEELTALAIDHLGVANDLWSYHKESKSPGPSRPCCPHVLMAERDISHEGLRLPLREEGVSFQRLKTWKTSRDPEHAAKKARVEHLYAIADGEVQAEDGEPEAVFCMDGFGPLNLMPHPGRPATAACEPSTHPRCGSRPSATTSRRT